MKSFADQMQRNQSKPCCKAGCPNHRHRLGRSCLKHRHATVAYDHHDGRSINPKEYRLEESEVEALFFTCRDHVALKAATGWFQLWTERALRDEAVPARAAMCLFHDQGITAERLLIRTIAVWMFSHRHHAALPSDQRLTRALALANLNLLKRVTRDAPAGKYYPRLNAVAKRELGPVLRQYLAPLFANVVVALEQRHEIQQAVHAALRTPFACESRLQLTPPKKELQ